MKTGELIKQLRKDKHMTQEELANYIGVQKSAVAKWENGRVKNLKRETIGALAILFGVSPAYLLGQEKERLLLSDEEMQIIKAFRKATAQQKKVVAVALGTESH